MSYITFPYADATKSVGKLPDGTDVRPQDVTVFNRLTGEPPRGEDGKYLQVMRCNAVEGWLLAWSHESEIDIRVEGWFEIRYTPQEDDVDDLIDFL